MLNKKLLILIILGPLLTGCEGLAKIDQQNYTKYSETAKNNQLSSDSLASACLEFGKNKVTQFNPDGSVANVIEFAAQNCDEFKPQELDSPTSNVAEVASAAKGVVPSILESAVGVYGIKKNYQGQKRIAESNERIAELESEERAEERRLNAEERALLIERLIPEESEEEEDDQL